MKGRFKPGESGNIKGRPKGAKNRVSRSLKEILSDFLNDILDELPIIWNSLKPREKAQMIRDLLPFVLAKMQSVNMEMDLQSLPESEIDRIIDKLLNNQNNGKR